MLPNRFAGARRNAAEFMTTRSCSVPMTMMSSDSICARPNRCGRAEPLRLRHRVAVKLDLMPRGSRIRSLRRRTRTKSCPPCCAEPQSRRPALRACLPAAKDGRRLRRCWSAPCRPRQNAAGCRSSIRPFARMSRTRGPASVNGGWIPGQRGGVKAAQWRRGRTICKRPRSGPFAYRPPAPPLGCFYSATLAWNPTAVDTRRPAGSRHPGEGPDARSASGRILPRATRR